MLFRRLSAILLMFLFSWGPGMASSFAALEVKIVGTSDISDKTKVTVRIDNPVDFAMHAVYFRVVCGSADQIRYRALVVSPQGKLDAGPLIAQEHPDAIIVVDEGFPGGSSRDVVFEVPAATGIDMACRLDMRGSW